MSEEENNEDENPADFEEEDFPEDIEDEDDLEDAPVAADDDDEEDEEEEEDESGPASVSDSNDDDDDDPADVEADLDAILKDRIASGEDEDAEESADATPKKDTPAQSDDESIESRRKGEVNCPTCFLIIEAQIAKENGECPHCGGSV